MSKTARSGCRADGGGRRAVGSHHPAPRRRPQVPPRGGRGGRRRLGEHLHCARARARHVEQPEPGRPGGQPPARLRHDLKGARTWRRHSRPREACASPWRSMRAWWWSPPAPRIAPSCRSRRTRRGPRSWSGGPPWSASRPGAAIIVMVKMPHVYGMRLLRRNGVTVRVAVPEGAPGRRGHSVGRHRDQRAGGRGGRQDRQRRYLHRRRGGRRDAKTASGNITIGTVGGDIRAYTASGDLRCSSVAGAATFSTTSGDLEVGRSRQQGRGQGDVGRRAPGRAGRRRPGR